MTRRWALLLLLLLHPTLIPARQEAAELFIESSLSPPDPYVQQQVTYEIRVYRRSSLLQGDLLAPEIPGVVVEPLSGEEEPRWIEVGGREYQLIRSRYLLFPQRSGTILLPGAVYSGRQAFARGEALELKVRPRPGIARGDTWLPARELRLEERWIPTVAPWSQGRPVERRVIIQARGLTAAQLPAPPVAQLPGLRIRRVGTEFGDRIEGGDLVGRREDRLLYLPLRSGPIELPPLALEWWSTDKEGAGTATLPAHRFQVGAAVAPALSVAETDIPVSFTEPNRWPGLLTHHTPLLEALTAIVALGLMLLHTPLRRLLRLRLLRDRFAAACRRNRPRAAWQALAAWSRLNWDSPPASPGVLAGRLADAGAAAALWSLDATLYDRPAPRWDGPGAARAIKPALKRPRTRRRRSAALPGLDP